MDRDGGVAVGEEVADGRGVLVVVRDELLVGHRELRRELAQGLAGEQLVLGVGGAAAEAGRQHLAGQRLAASAAVVFGIRSRGNFTVLSHAGWLKLSESTMTTLVLSMLAVRPWLMLAASAW